MKIFLYKIKLASSYLSESAFRRYISNLETQGKAVRPLPLPLHKKFV